MTDAATEIFRSSYRAECHDRAFMLAAVGISSAIEFDAGGYRLMVADADGAAALEHLDAYERERRIPPPAVPEPVRPWPYAWVGCAGYVIVLLSVALAMAYGWWRLDAFDTGEVNAAAIKHGQWWRAWTALTLHVDGAHLFANLAAGVWFGYLAAAAVGSGTAWFLTVNGAAIANLCEALLGPSDHRSVGASTAVFTALGVLVSHAWRRGASVPQRWAARWSPLVAGAVLLGWFGSEGEGTDVVAHVLGFLAGCALGSLVAMPAIGRPVRRAPQWLQGILAILTLAVAWGLALARG